MSTDPLAPYPVVLRLAGRLCLVVGGGEVARRKVRHLLSAGALVRVVAPQIHPDLQGVFGVELLCRPFTPNDLTGVFLVFAATNERSVNARVAACAEKSGLLVNIADDPDGSHFHLPAILQRGALTVAVSSGGGSPVFAALLRDRLAAELGPEWEIFCQLATVLRQKQLTGEEASAYNRAVISALFMADLPRLLASQDEVAINQLLTRVTGIELTLADLGIQFGKETT